MSFIEYGPIGVNPTPAVNPLNPILGNANTSPRVIWASNSEGTNLCAGQNQNVNQFIASRVATRMAGGTWSALSALYSGAYQVSGKSRIGVTTHSRAQIAANLERPNGTITTANSSPNTGGTRVAFTFQDGLTTGYVQGGQLSISDFIFASAYSLSSFEVTDRTRDWWVRTAMSKTAAGDLISSQECWSEYPYNSHGAQCTAFAAAQTLIGANIAGVTGSGTDGWRYNLGSGQDVGVMSHLGLLGVPASGQKAVLVLGTSIASTFQIYSLNDGSAIGPFTEVKQGTFRGVWNQLAAENDVSMPCLNLALNSSKVADVWSTTHGLADEMQAANARKLICDLAQYFDVVVCHDPENDANDADFTTSYGRMLTALKSANPKIQTIAVRYPRDYVSISGGTAGLDANTDDGKWTKIATYLGTTLNAIIDLRLGTATAADKYWPVITDRLTGTATAGSTTSLTTGVAMLPNQYRHSWVRMTSGTAGNIGLKRAISSNTAAGVLTVAAFPNAIAASDGYVIEGNTSNDGIHPNMQGVWWMRDQLKTSFFAVAGIPRFTRTG